MSFDWGVGSDPQGEASVPVFSEISALELYDHEVRARKRGGGGGGGPEK